MIKTFIWNFYLELSLAQKFPIIFQFFYIILSSEGGDDEKRIRISHLNQKRGLIFEAERDFFILPQIFLPYFD